MSWFHESLPPYIPICRKMRQGKYSSHYEVEAWAYDSIVTGFGQGVREWVPQAVSAGRKIAMHGFIPGAKLEKIYNKERGLYLSAWKEAAKYVLFSFYLEADAWYELPLLEGKRLQHLTMEIGEDMHYAGIPMIWLLLETREGGMRDIDFYANYANKHQMSWVCHNITGARDPKVMMEQLQVYAAYHARLNKNIGVVINGPGSEKRIRMIYKIFEGRNIVIANAARIENVRRGFNSVI